MKRTAPDGKPLLVHATTVALGPLGIMIRGASGSGKSDLALRFLSEQAAMPGETRPRRLVADDQTELTRDADGLVAACPKTIRGKLEVRGVGIIPIDPTAATARLVLLVDLVDSPAKVPRLPLDRQTETILGVALPRVALYPFEPSAPLKLALWAALSG